MKKVGSISKFFKKPNVAAIELTDTLEIGDKVKFQGAHTDFTQKIESMEIDREPVERAGKGQSVGVKVKKRVRPTDEVYKIENED